MPPGRNTTKTEAGTLRCRDACGGQLTGRGAGAPGRPAVGQDGSWAGRGRNTSMPAMGGYKVCPPKYAPPRPWIGYEVCPPPKQKLKHCAAVTLAAGHSLLAGMLARRAACQWDRMGHERGGTGTLPCRLWEAIKYAPQVCPPAIKYAPRRL